MRLKELIRWVTPPVIFQLAKRLRGKGSLGAYGLWGDYHSWAEALAASTGYDNECILEKTRASLLKVKNGEAAYERDSVIFDEIQYAWPLLAGLMWVGARCGGRLNVLDFGGSLGSTFFQNRAFLSRLSDVRWNVIEQPRHVETGTVSFADNHLHFYEDIGACMADTQPNVVLLSSVLQYLPHPYAVLAQIQELPCDHLIIDRTPFWEGSTDRLCVQNVPPSIYPASYPSWIFSKQHFVSHFSKNWEIVTTFCNPDQLAGPVELSYEGAILVRNKTVS